MTRQVSTDGSQDGVALAGQHPDTPRSLSQECPRLITAIYRLGYVPLLLSLAIWLSNVFAPSKLNWIAGALHPLTRSMVAPNLVSFDGVLYPRENLLSPDRLAIDDLAVAMDLLVILGLVAAVTLVVIFNRRIIAAYRSYQRSEGIRKP